MTMQSVWKACRRMALAATVAGSVFAVIPAQAQPGPGMGPGMMGGGYGYGHGYGYGMGPMMGGGGMGPGMMDGPGGCPMMGLGPLWELNLTADQKKKIDALMTQQREQHWSIMRAISENYAKLRTLYSAETLDANAIGKVYEEIHKNQRAMIDSAIRNRNQIYAMLTPEQKKQLKR